MATTDLVLIENPSIVLNPTARNISNSEASCFNSCRKQYKYAYVDAIASRKGMAAPNKGTCVHLILERYYEHAVLGDSVIVAEAAAWELWNELVMAALQPDHQFSIDVLNAVQIIIRNYFRVYRPKWDQWEVLATERKYTIPLNNEYNFSFTLDMLIRVRATGKLWIVDHKTAYDFDEKTYTFSGQFPKYIAAMRFTGADVQGVIINCIRTRILKAPADTDLFKRSVFTANKAQQIEALREQMLTSQEIQRVRSENGPFPRTLSSIVCKWCSYQGPCLESFRGGSEQVAIAAGDFIHNPYGYNDGVIEGQLTLDA